MRKLVLEICLMIAIIISLLSPVLAVADNVDYIGSCPTTGNAQGVFVAGDYAYVADGTSGLQIIDISTPTSPSIVGTCDTPGSAYEVFVVGDYAYVADYDYGLQVIDISTPSSPSLEGSYDTPYYAVDIYVEGNYAYVADNYSSLQIIDVTDPSNPTFESEYNTMIVMGVCVAGDYAYTVGWSTLPEYNNIEVIDISTPSSPTQEGSLYLTGGWAADVFVLGEYAYVAADGGYYIINISDPSNPSVEATEYTNTYNDVFALGDYAYLVGVEDYITGILNIMNVTDPQNPYLAGSYETPDSPGGVYVVGDLVFVADGSSLQILSFEGPEDFPYVPGDANMHLGGWPPYPIAADVTYLVNYFRLASSFEPCYMYNPNASASTDTLFWASADVNGDCRITGADVVYLVNRLRGIVTELQYCPDYPPAWLTWQEAPPVAPDGWPPCHEPPAPGYAEAFESSPDPELIFWFGHPDSTSIPATIGEVFPIDVYVQTSANTYGGDIHIPLGADNDYIQNLEDTGKVYYPLTDWDIVNLLEPQGSPPNPPGWSSKSLVGWADAEGSHAPKVHSLTPIKVATLYALAADDPGLVGSSIDCLDVGGNPTFWTIDMGDTIGLGSPPARANVLPVKFKEKAFYYLAGDANMSNETVDVGNPLTGPWRVGGDVVFLVNYFDIEYGNQPCLMYNPNNTDDYQGGPVNGYYFASGDATGEGLVTGGDVSRLVSYFGGTAEIKWYGWDKPDPENYYTPSWLNNRGSGLDQPVPALDALPEGWPDCQIPPPAGAKVLPSEASNK